MGGSDSPSASEEPKSEPPPPQPEPPTTGNTVALKRLVGLSRHLATTPKGGRHQALYTIARTLGGLVALRLLTHADIHTALHAAADRNGLLAEDGDRNITQTIADGIAKGIDDGPDPGHRERVEGSAYTLTPSSGADDDDDDVPEIDWPTFKFEDFDTTRWLIEPIIPAGSSVALYATSKTGKSLLAFDIVAAAASGRPILGGDPLDEPIHILYVDQEMTRREAWDRASSLGYFDDAHEEAYATLGKHMHYANMFPWPPLDTEAGGAKLLKKARKVGAKLVVIDTLIRTVDGEENSADTIKNFYRHTGMLLKEDGIALLRIDHAGKDLTRGQRGTSAKRDDVEVVWFLKKDSELPDRIMLTLVNEASRVDWVDKDIDITRHLAPLAHTIPTSLPQLTVADIEIVNYLQDQGLWGHNVSNRSAREVINLSHLAAKNHRLAHIVKWMQKYGDHPEGGERAGEHTLSSRGERGGERGAQKGNAQVSEGEREGNAAEVKNQGKGNTAPPVGGACFPPKIPTKRKARFHGRNPRNSSGPAGAHPEVPLDSAPSASVHLQDQGLWGHNVTNRDARDVINLSSLAAQSSRLVHIVKWMQRYGDTPPEVAEHGAEREMGRGAEHGAEREGLTRNMQVRGAERERNAAELKKQGKRNIAPPF